MAVTTPLLELRKAQNAMPFEIHTMEWIDQNRWEQNSIPHRHNYFVIIWVKKGGGEHLIDLEKFQLKDNTIYCVTPGQVHLMNILGPVSGYVISFTAEFMGLDEENFSLLFKTGLFHTFTHSPVLQVNEQLAEEMDDMAGRMMKEFSNYFLLRSEILRGFLKIFLVYLTRQVDKVEHTEAPSKNTDMLKKFFALLEKNYLTKRMVTDYANEMIITPNYLNEVVKKFTGFPASHHIQQRIILEAKRKAVYSNLSMKEIAYELGFDDIAHFSKFFKNASGQSFTDFKKDISFQ